MHNFIARYSYMPEMAINLCIIYLTQLTDIGYHRNLKLYQIQDYQLLYRIVQFFDGGDIDVLMD